jgi:hypothetical protein
LRLSLFVILFISVVLSACNSSKGGYSKREFRKAKTLATYSRMANELQDDNLTLKENGYFEFHQTIWLIATIKQVRHVGTYRQLNDTILLDWLGTDPRAVRPFLSGKGILDSAANTIWFIDETTNNKSESLELRPKRK